MLRDFLAENRQELIDRCCLKAALRFVPLEAGTAATHGVPSFLKQLVDTLSLEDKSVACDRSGPQPTPAPTEIGRGAALHGSEMLRLGYSVDQVVHDYGDVCQSVTELALEKMAEISVDEFRTLNRCLDNAIADAVTSFGSSRQILTNENADTLQERLNAFADEHLRLVKIAIQAFGAIKTGDIGFSGATGTLLTEALDDLLSLGDRSLPNIRLASAKTVVVLP